MGKTIEEIMYSNNVKFIKKNAPKNFIVRIKGHKLKFKFNDEGEDGWSYIFSYSIIEYDDNKKYAKNVDMGIDFGISDVQPSKIGALFICRDAELLGFQSKQKECEFSVKNIESMIKAYKTWLAKRYFV